MTRIAARTKMFSRQLRREMTDAERALWRHLRMRQFSGAKFRRQHPIDRYVADFACVDAGLVVELDGSQHAEIAARDALRTRAIESRGFRVLRFFDNEVLQSIDAVKEAIWIALAAMPDRETDRRNPHPDLPPARGKENPSPTETALLPPLGRGRAGVGVEHETSPHPHPLPPAWGKE